jgi:hypothetical protein
MKIGVGIPNSVPGAGGKMPLDWAVIFSPTVASLDQVELLAEAVL